MIRRHDMPFGASYDGNETLFRLWAPTVAQVALELGSAEGWSTLPMQHRNGGWHQCRADAKPGARYRFRLPDGLAVPDPASRYQPEDVHGPSEVVDPASFAWEDEDWHGRPWAEAVIYELHVGAFTREGTFRAVASHLDSLVELGVTAIELMPVADFPGRRNWGYDGAYLYAPDARYGRPDDLKSLVQRAHRAGLMVLLDVVYNHLGPDGNYIGAFADPFFTERHRTPWGGAIDFGGPESRTVRDFFIQNALFWLEEYHFDGLRLDAVHAIHDESHPHILVELARTVRERGPVDRHVHLVLENDANEARRIGAGAGSGYLYNAQWNDDFHHVVHHMLTGEQEGYYQDYAEGPAQKLARALTEGFVYQGDPSTFRHGRPRGEPSGDLPLTAFVSFVQNHDQVGNRAFGERIGALAPEDAVAAASALYLLAPPPPLIFMGEDWDADAPFPFFCDFGPELADAVREGRREEFARFPAFRDESARERIPDPNAEATFAMAVLDPAAEHTGRHGRRRDLFRQLLALRARHVVPRLLVDPTPKRGARILGPGALTAWWRFGDGSTLTCFVNLSADGAAFAPVEVSGRLLHASRDAALAAGPLCEMPPWFVAWLCEDA